MLNMWIFKYVNIEYVCYVNLHVKVFSPHIFINNFNSQVASVYLKLMELQSFAINIIEILRPLCTRFFKWLVIQIKTLKSLAKNSYSYIVYVPLVTSKKRLVEVENKLHKVIFWKDCGLFFFFHFYIFYFIFFLHFRHRNIYICSVLLGIELKSGMDWKHCPFHVDVFFLC